MPVQKSSEVATMVGSHAVGDANGDINLEFDQMDNKIIAATLKAFESGSLTPLIKEELRCTIQSRRLAEGKGEMKVEFKKPSRKKEMTDEERNRALKRRTQNREAAQRFRQKQKDTSDYLSTKIKRLESSSTYLTKELDRLRDERGLLQQMFESHLLVCTNPHITRDSTPPYQHSYTYDVLNASTSHTPISTSSSMTGCLSVTDSTPDTAYSDSSVFFADDDPNYVTLEPVIEIPTFGNAQDKMTEALMCYDLEVGCEETVVNIDDTDSEFDEERRPESCSSTDTLMFKSENCSADWNCLSQSIQGVSSAFVKAHFDSCSSEPFEPMSDDLFFIQDDITP